MGRGESARAFIALSRASTRSAIVSARPGARHIGFFSLWFLSLILLRVPLISLAGFALQDERYSPILLIPFISACVVWLRRNRIFPGSRCCPSMGLPLLLVGIALLISTHFWPLFSHQNGGVSVEAFAIILVWMAIFVLCYGMPALHGAAFPFLFLLLMVPMPLSLMEKAVFGLQKGSAEISYLLFKLVGIPVFRDGFMFSLPGVEIEVAKECSGIRSSLSLVITSILAGQVFLGSKWNQIWFALLAVPVVIFKNAVRIVAISLLGVYIDRSFLFGNLHRHGGLPFSLIAFAILFVALQLLRKSEASPEKRDLH